MTSKRSELLIRTSSRDFYTHREPPRTNHSEATWNPASSNADGEKREARSQLGLLEESNKEKEREHNERTASAREREKNTHTLAVIADKFLLCDSLRRSTTLQRLLPCHLGRVHRRRLMMLDVAGAECPREHRQRGALRSTRIRHQLTRQRARCIGRDGRRRRRTLRLRGQRDHHKRDQHRQRDRSLHRHQAQHSPALGHIGQRQHARHIVADEDRHARRAALHLRGQRRRVQRRVGHGRGRESRRGNRSSTSVDNNLWLHWFKRRAGSGSVIADRGSVELGGCGGR